MQAHLKAALATATPKLSKELAKREFHQLWLKNWLHHDNFKNTSYNSDGLINWLRRARIGLRFPVASQSKIIVDPRLPFATRTILSQPQKSMGEKIILLIKSCVTRTVPAAETKSIGLQADARVVMVFASPSGQIYYNVTNPAHLSGRSHLDSFIVTTNARPLIGTLQKHMPTPTRTATN